MSLAEFNVDVPLLSEVFALHARWLRDKPAVVFEGREVSWQELWSEAYPVANGLIDQGLKQGDAVGLMMGNSVEMLEVLLGILAAGCISVPLNLSITDDAIERMIEDSDCRVLFISADQAFRLASFRQKPPLCIVVGGSVTGLTDYELWKSGQETNKPSICYQPDASMNIIYSSGTTGQPKGIVHTHLSRLQWSYALSISLHYHRCARTLCTLPLYSNISWLMLLCTWLPGGTLYLERTFDAARFLALTERHAITHTTLVPVQIQRILSTLSEDPKDLTSLQSVTSCGASLSVEMKAEMSESFSARLFELYGLTEGVITTIDLEESAGHQSSVGKPLIGTDLKIIDPQGDELESGMRGEIVFRGSTLMPGYHNRPDATGAATWLDSDGRAWLRTGDIGYLDDAGFLYITGRAKSMILSGGQNIYPEDIESVLNLHPEVEEAAVIGIPSEKWGESPAAFVVLKRGVCADPEMLRQWANERLGRHQRIAALVLEQSLPRNPNGKVLKHQLHYEQSD